MIVEANRLPALVADDAENLPSPVLVAKAKRAADLAKHATAASTRRVYRVEFAAFERWARGHGTRALPTTPEILATYLSDMHDAGRAASRLGLMRAAVLWAHKEAGHPLDSRAECVRKVLAGAKRMRASDPKRVRPLLVEDFHELSAAMGEDLAATRDRAMMALGLARALRGPSELITLDLDRLGSPDGRGFIEIGSAGITVHLVRSKTSQETTRSMFVERGPAASAVETWVKAAGITAGTPLWRPIYKGIVGDCRLSAAAWHRNLKRRVAQLYRLRGFSPDDATREARKFATHSLRAGTITSLADAGATLAEIRDVTGHAEGSAPILLGYMRRQSAGVAQIKKLGL